MRLTALGLTAIVALGVGAATHAALLFGSPVWATDRQFAQGFKRGGAWNILTHSPVPKAGGTSVPLANPDSFTSRAYIDLAKGPLVLSGPVPKSCAYWSVSVFAHNTDTALIMSDRDFPDGTASIGIARVKGDIGQSVDAVAVVDSNKAFLLVRCFMRDPTDKAYMATLDVERHLLTLEPAPLRRGS